MVSVDVKHHVYLLTYKLQALVYAFPSSSCHGLGSVGALQVIWRVWSKSKFQELVYDILALEGGREEKEEEDSCS